MSSAVKSDRFYQDRLGTEPNWQNGKWSQQGVVSNPTYRRKLWRPGEYHRRNQRDSGREHAGRCCARGYSAPLLVWIYFKIYLDLFRARSRNLLVFLVLLMRRETVLCQDRLGTNKNGNDPYSQEKEETVSHTHVSLSLSHSHTFFLVFVWVCVGGGQIALVALSKTPTRLPEAAFVTFAPAGPGAERTPLLCYVYYCVN